MEARIAVINNDVLRRVRYIFDFSDSAMLAIFKLGGHTASKDELKSWLTKEGELGFILCEDVRLAEFLNGFIIHKRGRKDGSTPKAETSLDNNMILRKLKIALNLQANDLLGILKMVGFSLSKHELSALFRRPDHKNYRPCMDQLLRNMLDGMEKFYRNSAGS